MDTDATHLNTLIDNIEGQLAAALTALAPPRSIPAAIGAIIAAQGFAAHLRTDINNFVLKYKNTLTNLVNDEIKAIEDDVIELEGHVTNLCQIIDDIKALVNIKGELPKEPYTPAIKDLSIDYVASAGLYAPRRYDIDLVHLYPLRKHLQTRKYRRKPHAATNTLR